MRISTVSLSIFLSLFLLLSCGTESTPIYTLSTSVVGEGTISPSGGDFEEGEVVTISGIPSEQWIFNNWSGDEMGSSTTLSITMDSDKNVVGNFTERLYPLNITVVGEGSVEEEVIQSKSEYTFGTLVQLTPNPSNGWKFVEWGDWDGAVDDEDRIVVSVDSEVNITVTFERVNYPLTITIEGEGTVEQEVVQSKSTDYPYETVVQLTPLPSENYEFVEWSGDISSTEEVVTVTLNGVVNVTVTFRHVLEDRILQQVNGFIQEETNYPSPGTNIFSTTWDYDTHENLTEFISYDSDDNVSYRDTYTYDSSNNLTEEIRYASDESVSFRITYTYDSNNNLNEQIYYESSGSVSVSFTYAYDSMNNLSERILYNSSGSVSLKNTYTYDSNNNLTEQIYLRSDDSVLGRDTYIYDSNNNLSEQIFYGSDDSVLGRDTYTYDSANNLIKWDYNSATSNWITEYEYDFNGFITDLYDVYNFLISESWYKTITTENRENIYYERGLNKSSQKSSTLISRNQQLIWNFDRLNRKTNALHYRYIMEKLEIDFLPNPHPHQPNSIY